MAWNDDLLLKLTNIISFLLFFSTGLYSSLAPGGYYHGKETYFTPASWIFEIWVLIDLLLLGFVIYQVTDQANSSREIIGYRLAAAGVISSIAIHLQVSGHTLVSFIFFIFLTMVVSTVYYTLTRNHSAGSILELVVVHLPFSLWHSWAIVSLLLSAFTAFTHGTRHEHPSVVVRVLVVIAEAFLAATATAYAFQSKKGDVAGALVIVLTLFAIFDHQQNGLIKYFALGSAIWASIAVLKSIYFTVRGDGHIALALEDEERAPLVA